MKLRNESEVRVCACVCSWFLFIGDRHITAGFKTKPTLMVSITVGFVIKRTVMQPYHCRFCMKTDSDVVDSTYFHACNMHAAIKVITYEKIVIL